VFRWLGQAKRKQENNAAVALPPFRKAIPNKRVFGTDLTNIDNKQGKLDLVAENKVNLMQGASNMVKTFDRKLGQGKRSDFVYGPFVTPGFGRQTECEPCTWQDQELTYTAIT
jgi:transcription factor E2F7/8